MMAATQDPMRPPSRLLLLAEGRALWEAGAALALWPLLQLTPRGDGHPVLVLPGLVASDMSTKLLRRYLEGRGYDAHGWGLGRNFGPREGIEDGMIAKLEALHAESGRKVSLIGWSLGGVYARELAKELPDLVRGVITLGSPFAGHPKSTNAWRVYELTSGREIEREHEQFDLPAAPPVPTTSIFSRTDGIVAWQGSIQEHTPGHPNTENIEVVASHIGLGVNPSAWWAVADRLAQPEDHWRPFDRTGLYGLKSLIYPDPHRA